MTTTTDFALVQQQQQHVRRLQTAATPPPPLQQNASNNNKQHQQSSSSSSEALFPLESFIVTLLIFVSRPIFAVALFVIEWALGRWSRSELQQHQQQLQQHQQQQQQPARAFSKADQENAACMADLLVSAVLPFHLARESRDAMKNNNSSGSNINSHDRTLTATSSQQSVASLDSSNNENNKNNTNINSAPSTTTAALRRVIVHGTNGSASYHVLRRGEDNNNSNNNSHRAAHGGSDGIILAIGSTAGDADIKNFVVTRQREASATAAAGSSDLEGASNTTGSQHEQQQHRNSSASSQQHSNNSTTTTNNNTSSAASDENSCVLAQIALQLAEHCSVVGNMTVVAGFVDFLTTPEPLSSAIDRCEALCNQVCSDLSTTTRGPLVLVARNVTAMLALHTVVRAARVATPVSPPLFGMSTDSLPGSGVAAAATAGTTATGVPTNAVVVAPPSLRHASILVFSPFVGWQMPIPNSAATGSGWMSGHRNLSSDSLLAGDASSTTPGGGSSPALTPQWLTPQRNNSNNNHNQSNNNNNGEEQGQLPHSGSFDEGDFYDGFDDMPASSIGVGNGAGDSPIRADQQQQQYSSIPFVGTVARIVFFARDVIASTIHLLRNPDQWTVSRLFRLRIRRVGSAAWTKMQEVAPSVFNPALASWFPASAITFLYPSIRALIVSDSAAPFSVETLHWARNLVSQGCCVRVIEWSSASRDPYSEFQARIMDNEGTAWMRDLLLEAGVTATRRGIVINNNVQQQQQHHDDHPDDDDGNNDTDNSQRFKVRFVESVVSETMSNNDNNQRNNHNHINDAVSEARTANNSVATTEGRLLRSLPRSGGPTAHSPPAAAAPHPTSVRVLYASPQQQLRQQHFHQNNNNGQHHQDSPDMPAQQPVTALPSPADGLPSVAPQFPAQPQHQQHAHNQQQHQQQRNRSLPRVDSADAWSLHQSEFDSGGIH